MLPVLGKGIIKISYSCFRLSSEAVFNFKIKKYHFLQKGNNIITVWLVANIAEE